MKLIIIGLMLSAIIFIINTIADNIIKENIHIYLLNQYILIVVIAPVVEETAKFISLRLFGYKNGFIIVLIFVLFELIYYIYLFGSSLISLRLALVVIHMCLYMGHVFAHDDNKPIKGWFLMTTTHGSYNAAALYTFT